MAKAFFSIEKIKIKNARQFNGKYKHNYRLCNVENADPERKNLNKELIPLDNGENYYSTFKKILNSLDYYRTHKLVEKGNNATVKGFEVMLTYGKDNFPENFNQNDWEQVNVKWLQDTFGKGNVISAVLHMDETTPHIHAIIVPVHNGRLNAKTLIGGPAGLLEKQESYSRAMEALGLEPRTKYSVAHHENVMKFYSAINDAVIEQLPKPFKNNVGEYNESLDDYFERANQYLVKRNLQNLNTQKEMERQIIEAKNDTVSNAIEREQYINEIEYLRRIMIESIEKNEHQKKILEENSRKIQTIELLNFALKNYPDDNFIEKINADIGKLIQFAKEHVDDIDLFKPCDFEPIFDEEKIREISVNTKISAVS